VKKIAMSVLWVENKLIIIMIVGALAKFSNPSVITIAINVGVF
jgi:hypothetical protein